VVADAKLKGDQFLAKRGFLPSYSEPPESSK
jgi:hypothetical protein